MRHSIDEIFGTTIVPKSKPVLFDTHVPRSSLQLWVGLCWPSKRGHVSSPLVVENTVAPPSVAFARMGRDALGSRIELMAALAVAWGSKMALQLGKHSLTRDMQRCIAFAGPYGSL